MTTMMIAVKIWTTGTMMTTVYDDGSEDMDNRDDDDHYDDSGKDMDNRDDYDH